jgi:hypothetical protein
MGGNWCCQFDSTKVAVFKSGAPYKHSTTSVNLGISDNALWPRLTVSRLTDTDLSELQPNTKISRIY